MGRVAGAADLSGQCDCGWERSGLAGIDEAVWRDGKVFDRDALAGLLARAKEAAKH